MTWGELKKLDFPDDATVCFYDKEYGWEEVYHVTHTTLFRISDRKTNAPYHLEDYKRENEHFVSIEEKCVCLS